MSKTQDLIHDLGLDSELAALRADAGNIHQAEISDGEIDKEILIDDRIAEGSYRREDVELAARSDLNFLAGLAMPEVFEYMFPPMFLAIWSWLLSFTTQARQFPKLALGIPRGFTKTTFIKLFVLYCILFTQKKFILIISSTEGHAKNIIADIIAMLSEPNIKRVFGDWSVNTIIDKQEFKRFRFRGREVSIAGLGAEGSIRGLNVGNNRPDIMIFEDFQTKEDSENVTLADALLERMTGTIMKAKDPRGCMYLFVGNMYNTPGCILKKLKASKFWLKFIVGGILENGESLWEELHPIKQLLDEFDSDEAMGKADVFFAEVLNDENAGIKAGIDLSKINTSQYITGERPQGKFILLDPAGSTSGADNNAVGYVEVFDGIPILTEIIQGKWSPLQLICQGLILALVTRTKCIFVENVAYQASLLFWFDHVCKQHNLTGFEFLPINPLGKSKNARIRDMLKASVSSKLELQIHQKVISRFKDQARSWNPLTRNNKDEILDIASYMPRVVQEYAGIIGEEYSVEKIQENEEFEAGGVMPAWYTSPI